MPARDPQSSSSAAPAAALLAWYDANRRDLPWRAGAGEPAEPYRVWLSEIMLQQTRAATVAAYFRDFIRRWPTLDALAQASLDDVLRAWAGLGYYARARNLHRCAKLVVGELGGIFPADAAALAKLPGIGPYTAGAIAAIAFDRPAVAVDGNTERVVARFFAVATPLPAGRRVIRELAGSLVPARRPGDFAQALMDLGALVCLPAAPRCAACPWAAGCRANRMEATGEYPRKAPRRRPPTRYGSAFVIEREDGAVFLRRRPAAGLLGGMMEVPSSPWPAARPCGVKSAPLRASWRRLRAPIEHKFTHFRLVLAVYRTQVSARRSLGAAGDARWVARADLAREALPSLMRKVLAAGLRERG